MFGFVVGTIGLAAVAASVAIAVAGRRCRCHRRRRRQWWHCVSGSPFELDRRLHKGVGILPAGGCVHPRLRGSGVRGHGSEVPACRGWHARWTLVAVVPLECERLATPTVSDQKIVAKRWRAVSKRQECLDRWPRPPQRQRATPRSPRMDMTPFFPLQAPKINRHCEHHPLCSSDLTTPPCLGLFCPRKGPIIREGVFSDNLIRYVRGETKRPEEPTG